MPDVRGLNVDDDPIVEHRRIDPNEPLLASAQHLAGPAMTVHPIAGGACCQKESHSISQNDGG